MIFPAWWVWSGARHRLRTSLGVLGADARALGAPMGLSGSIPGAGASLLSWSS